MSPSFEILAGLGCLGLLALVDFPFACPAIVVTASTLLAVAAGIACRRERRAPQERVGGVFIRGQPNSD
jgi:hypothetical protein